MSWKGTAPFRASAENESELLDCDDAIFLTSSDAAASAPLHMNEFLEVVDHKNKSKITPSSSEPSFLHNLDVEVEKEWEKLFFLVFIGFSILVMLTLRGCVKKAMRGCPLCKR